MGSRSEPLRVSQPSNRNKHISTIYQPVIKGTLCHQRYEAGFLPCQIVFFNTGRYPLVNVYITMERFTIFTGKTDELSTGPFSIAMLVITRGYITGGSFQPQHQNYTKLCPQDSHINKSRGWTPRYDEPPMIPRFCWVKPTYSWTHQLKIPFLLHSHFAGEYMYIYIYIYTIKYVYRMWFGCHHHSTWG